MVQDIRPEANALLRQISSMSKSQELRVGSQETGRKIQNTQFPIRKPAVNHTQAARLTQPKTPPPFSLHLGVRDGVGEGISVVEKVFNQIYSKSGFIEEQEVVPAKVAQLGTRLDVYA